MKEVFGEAGLEALSHKKQRKDFYVDSGKDQMQPLNVSGTIFLRRKEQN